MKRVVLLSVFVYITIFASNLEDAQKLYNQGNRNYSITALKGALSLLSTIPSGQEFDYYLLQGQCYARIQHTYMVKGQKSSARDYGLEAEARFTKALGYKPNSIDAWAGRTIVYQNLASHSWDMGAKYGPKSADGLKKLKVLNSSHYYTLLIDGIALLRAPAIFGGDPAKALIKLKLLSEAYPDDEDVSLNLAEAYDKNKNPEKASEIVSSVLSTNPSNLWAKKLVREFE